MTWDKERASDIKAYRLQQFLKWKGGWAALYYALTEQERRVFFDRLAEQILEFEKGEGDAGRDTS